MRISLDSNVIADQEFIEWLHINLDRFEIYISVVVLLETYHWYNIRKIAKSEFEEDISKLQGGDVNLVKNNIFTISDNALSSNLKFKHHARDFIIGSHAQGKKSTLITNNLKHFEWLENVLTPYDLVLEITENQ